jgi:hypothetical protein
LPRPVTGMPPGRPACLSPTCWYIGREKSSAGASELPPAPAWPVPAPAPLLGVLPPGGASLAPGAAESSRPCAPRI